MESVFHSRWLVLFALMASVSVGLIYNFSPDRWHWNFESHWGTHVGEIQAWSRARASCGAEAELVVPTNPGWYIVLPALMSCDGETIPDGVALKTAGKVYLISRGSRRPIPDAATLDALAIDANDVIDSPELDSLPLGPPLPPLLGNLLRNNTTGECFVGEAGRFRYIPCDYVAVYTAVPNPQIYEIPEEATGAIPLGPPVRTGAGRGPL